VCCVISATSDGLPAEQRRRSEWRETNVRILTISEALPYPPDSGSPQRVYGLLLRLAREHEVWVATLLDAPAQAEGLAKVRDLGLHVEAAVYRRRTPVGHLPGLARYALQGKPLELRFKYSHELADTIRRLASQVDFDIVQIEHSDMALYLEALPAAARCRRILVFHNIIFRQWERIAQVERRPALRARAWLYSRMMRRWEPRYAARFDRCIAVSEADRALLKATNPNLRVDVAPNGVDTQRLQPLPREIGSRRVLFVGMMSYEANADAALFFCRQALPHLRRMVGDVETWIVGMNPPAEVLALAGDDVHVTGRVDDVAPYYQRSAVCVTPLRAGGGTRLKILEAMALGRPVVSSTVGCEGLDVRDGEHLLIADSPEQFARQTARLLSDERLCERIVRQARQLVEERYDWEVVAQRVQRIYADVLTDQEGSAA
jgi:sugar transferase (PEP-CTERM/EpsH1 system associated)